MMATASAIAPANVIQFSKPNGELYSYLLTCPQEPKTVRSLIIGSVFNESVKNLCGDEATQVLRYLQIIKRVKVVTYVVLSCGLVGLWLGIAVTVKTIGIDFFNKNNATSTKLFGFSEDAKTPKKAKKWMKFVPSLEQVSNAVEKVSQVTSGIATVGLFFTSLAFVLPPIGFYLISKPMISKSDKLLIERFKQQQKEIRDNFQKGNINIEECIQINLNRTYLVSNLHNTGASDKVNTAFVSLMDTFAGIHQWNTANEEMKSIPANDPYKDQLTQKIDRIREQLLAHGL